MTEAARGDQFAEAFRKALAGQAAAGRRRRGRRGKDASTPRIGPGMVRLVPRNTDVPASGGAEQEGTTA